MAFDFPASPTEGAVYTPAGGPTYTYSGGIWRTLPPATSALSSKSISDTPPLNPIHGQSWWNSVDGFSYIYYVDASGAPGQWVQESDASLPDAPNDGKTYQRRNGVWVVTQEVFDISGLPSLTIDVPAWAKRVTLDCLLTGNGSDIAPIMRLRPAGDAIVTAANVYSTYGVYTSTNSPGAWAALIDSTSNYFYMGNSHGSATIHSSNKVSLMLERTATNMTWDGSFVSTAYPTAGGVFLCQAAVLMGSSASTKLRLDGLYVSRVSGNFGASSTIAVEWF